MKGLMLGIVAGLAMLILGVGVWGARSASADNGPHQENQGMTTDACAGCHRAHTARGAYLLRVDEEALCETCHDGMQATTNVVDGVAQDVPGPLTGVAVGALRGGGFDFASIDTADPTWSRHVSGCAAGTDAHEYGSGSSNTPTEAACVARTPAERDALLHIGVLATPVATTSHHSIDTTADTVWGSGAIDSGAGGSLTLGCAKCHDPHGNGNYRILRTTPVADSDAAGMSDTFVNGVAIPDEVVKNYTTTNYMSYGNVPTTATVAGPGGDTNTGISAWCSQCHTRYLTAPGSYENDSGDDIFAFRHATTSYAPACIKCHAAHGTNAVADGFTDLVGWPGAVDADNFASPPGSGGGSRLLKMDNRGMCQKCHKR